MKVRLIKERSSEQNRLSLTLGREYEVLEISGDYYRILNDPESWPYGNDPVLFESELFEIIDPAEPECWVTEFLDGERYSAPFVWQDYFFEKYHDRDRTAHKVFWDSIKKYYPWTWAQRVGS